MENIGLIKYGQIANELPRLLLHIFWNNTDNGSYYLINYETSNNFCIFLMLLQDIATNRWVWSRDEYRMIRLRPVLHMCQMWDPKTDGKWPFLYAYYVKLKLKLKFYIKRVVWFKLFPSVFTFK